MSRWASPTLVFRGPQLLSRDDVPTLQSLSILLALMDNALARRNT